jgi:hypothetical protein
MVVLGLLGGLLPTAGGRGRGAPVASQNAASPRPLRSISLPDAAPVLPDGPNRDLVQAHCTLCHSPRLILTQPRLSEKKWGEVVRKMVTAYKAPVYGADATPEQQRAFEQAVVAYLMSVRGAQP